MSRSLLSIYKVEKDAFSVVSLHDPPDDIAYWRTKSFLERLEALELLRQIHYGQAAITGRLQRVLEIAQLDRSPQRKQGRPCSRRGLGSRRRIPSR